MVEWLVEYWVVLLVVRLVEKMVVYWVAVMVDLMVV